MNHLFVCELHNVMKSFNFIKNEMIELKWEEMFIFILSAFIFSILNVFWLKIISLDLLLLICSKSRQNPFYANLIRPIDEDKHEIA